MLYMNNTYRQLHNKLPDGRDMPSRFSTNPQDKRNFENFTQTHFFDWRRWIPLTIIVLSLNFTWWYQPLLHSTSLTGMGSTWHTLPLFVYSIMVSIGLTLVITQNFRSLISYLFFGISLLLTLTSFIQSRHEIFILLGLLSIFFILIQQPIIGLQNWLGLVVLSVLATFSIPVAIFYISNNFVTQRFLWQLVPMLFGFGFYFTPILMPNPDGRKLSILTLGLFLVAVLSHQIGLGTPLIIIFCLLGFILQFVKAKIGNWQNMGYILLLALSMFIIY